MVPAAVKNPVRYLERRLFAKQPLPIQAVGAKVLYDQMFVNRDQPGYLLPYWTLATSSSSEYLRQRQRAIDTQILPYTSIPAFTKRLERFRSYVVASRDLKILHVKRRNILRAHLSAILATSYSWVGRPIPADGLITLDCRDCLTAFSVTRELEDYFDAMFEQHDKLAVVYEEVCARPSEEFARLGDFLGLHLTFDANFRIKPPRRLSRIIGNYRQLQQQFAGTQWSEFFTE